MTTALIILAIIIAAALIYLGTLDGRFTVRRSLAFHADRKTIFDKVRDFRSWREWSPWLIHEPDTHLQFSNTPDQVNGWYSWDGKAVGAGILTHLKFNGEDSIEQRIEFRRPFKSVNKVWWEFEQQDDGACMVHWNMSGEMPFLFRFMAKKIPSFIGKDYDTGLYMLRGLLEPEAETLHISFDGPVEIPEQTALSIHFEGHLDELKQAMMEGFPRLGQYVDDQGLTASGNPFTIYHKVDLDKMHFNCDLAMPVTADTTSSEFEIKNYQGGRYFKTTLKGNYQFLELAWYQAYSHLRMHKIKAKNNQPSLEMYENDPATVKHTNEIVTSIYIPIQ